MYDNDFYKVDLFIFWRSIVSFILFTCLASLTLFYILGPMFLDIFALSLAWGALGIIIGNIWHAYKFGFSRKFLLVSTYLLIAFISINLIFIPNAIGYRNNLNEIKALNSNSIIEIRISNHEIKSKSYIAKFTEIAQMAGIYYVNHEIPLNEFKLSIIKKDGKVCYPATILTSRPNDVVISVKPYLFENDIIIPQGAVWLRELEQKTFK